MSKKQNQILVEKILTNIPQNIKPVGYLMEILDIGKESAYRRMRGEIPFTVNEVSKLSSSLGLSVDEIIGPHHSEREHSDLKNSSINNPDESFWIMLREYYNFIKNVNYAKEVEIHSSLNRISLGMYARFDLLFKFAYYKWIHQLNNVSLNLRLTDINLPIEIQSSQQKLKNELKHVRNCNYILSRNLLLPIAREIQYYHHRKLLTDEEVMQLKDELLKLVHWLESLMQKGVDEAGYRYYIYLSLLEVEVNSAYITYDGRNISQYWIYHVSSVNNQEACYMHKKWLDALKKHSILITRSNEMLQASFLNKQYEYIESLMKKDAGDLQNMIQQ
jgi:hypothetical protein